MKQYISSLGIITVVLAYQAANAGSLQWEPSDPFHCATPPAPAVGSTTTIFDTLDSCGLSLHDTVNDATQGASLGDSSGSTASGFKAQFALQYLSQPFLFGHAAAASGIDYSSLNLFADVDGNISTSSAAAERNSFLDERLQIYGHVGHQNLTGKSIQGVPIPDFNSTTGIIWRAGPLYESSGDFAVRNLLGEAAATFVAPGGFGQFTNLDGTGLKYVIQPWATIQTGENLHGLDYSREFDNTRLRLIAEPIVALGLANPQQFLGLGLTSVTLTVDDSFTVNPLEGKTILIGKTAETSPTTHNLFSVAFAAALGPFSFGPTYQIGQTAPVYKQSHTLSVNLKLAFGSSGPAGLGEAMSGGGK